MSGSEGPGTSRLSRRGIRRTVRPAASQFHLASDPSGEKEKQAVEKSPEWQEKRPGHQFTYPDDLVRTGAETLYAPDDDEEAVVDVHPEREDDGGIEDPDPRDKEVGDDQRR